MNHLTKNAFPEVRQPGDPDAVAEITAILQAAGHPNPSAWESDSLVQEAKPAAPKLQRFLINRYWRLKLASRPGTVTSVTPISPRSREKRRRPWVATARIVASPRARIPRAGL